MLQGWPSGEKGTHAERCPEEALEIPGGAGQGAPDCPSGSVRRWILALSSCRSADQRRDYLCKMEMISTSGASARGGSCGEHNDGGAADDSGIGHWYLQNGSSVQAPRKTSSLQDLSPPGTRQGKQSLADEKANAQKVIHRYRAVTGRGGARLASGNLSCLTSSPSPLPCEIWQPPWLPGFSWHTPAPESSFLFSESGMSLSPGWWLWCVI